MVTLTRIERSLAAHRAQIIDDDRLVHAAVALILRQSGDDFQILFMERAADDRDPWSGNVCFPGGKVEPEDGEARRAAERETLEEIGLELGVARYLGRLSDISASRLPFRVSCFVYLVTEETPFQLSDEVQDVFWVSLSHLRDPAHCGVKQVRFDGRALSYPGIDLPQPGKPVLWGLTYLMVMEFLGLDDAGMSDDKI